jgi:hypothetical protein
MLRVKEIDTQQFSIVAAEAGMENGSGKIGTDYGGMQNG